jgi:hypothetical protein
VNAALRTFSRMACTIKIFWRSSVMIVSYACSINVSLALALSIISVISYDHKWRSKLWHQLRSSLRIIIYGCNSFIILAAVQYLLISSWIILSNWWREDQTGRWKEWQIDRKMDRIIDRQTDKQNDRHARRWTEWQIDRQRWTELQTSRQTDRLTE